MESVCIISIKMLKLIIDFKWNLRENIVDYYGSMTLWKSLSLLKSMLSYLYLKSDEN